MKAERKYKSDRKMKSEASVTAEVHKLWWSTRFYFDLVDNYQGTCNKTYNFRVQPVKWEQVFIIMKVILNEKWLLVEIQFIISIATTTFLLVLSKHPPSCDNLAQLLCFHVALILLWKFSVCRAWFCLYPLPPQCSPSSMTMGSFLP